MIMFIFASSVVLVIIVAFGLNISEAFFLGGGVQKLFFEHIYLND